MADSHAHIRTPQPTKEIAIELYSRAEQDDPISPAEYRRLFIKGLAALLREADSQSYRLRELAENLNRLAAQTERLNRSIG